jgi:putative tricarboxylic transport membrane protein
MMWIKPTKRKPSGTQPATDGSARPIRVLQFWAAAGSVSGCLKVNQRTVNARFLPPSHTRNPDPQCSRGSLHFVPVFCTMRPTTRPVSSTNNGRKLLRAVRDQILALGKGLVRKRDFYAGGLMMLFGLVMALKGPTYRLGTLMHMGPGFMPTALGIILICLGILIAGAAVGLEEGEGEDILPAHPEWFAWGCILAGPVCFIIFGSYGGMVPAIFSCVLVSALGDRTATLKSSAILAALVTVFGVGLFSYILQIPMPILEWRGL